HHQRVQIAALELVRVARERGDIGYAVIVGAGAEHIARTQRREHCIPPSAAAADRGAGGGGTPDAAQMSGSGDHVLAAAYAPVPNKRLTEGASIARAAAVIAAHHVKATG